MAAVLACGPNAALSHRSAAELWGLLRPRQPIAVTIRGGSRRRRRPGIKLHRSPSLPPLEVTRHKGIPAHHPRAHDQGSPPGRFGRRSPPRDPRGRVSRAPGRRGCRTRAGPDEEQARAPLPAPLSPPPLPRAGVNIHVGPHEVDFLWRHCKLVVETDGYSGHRGRQAFEDDRAKDAELRVLGYTVVRFTYRQVTERWDWVEETVRALLAGK